ncbi:hypothetical protein YC2023_018888 [Brassica napus]
MNLYQHCSRTPITRGDPRLFSLAGVYLRLGFSFFSIKTFLQFNTSLLLKISSHFPHPPKCVATFVAKLYLTAQEFLRRVEILNQIEKEIQRIINPRTYLSGRYPTL